MRGDKPSACGAQARWEVDKYLSTSGYLSAKPFFVALPQEPPVQPGTARRTTALSAKDFRARIAHMDATMLATLRDKVPAPAPARHRAQRFSA